MAGEDYAVSDICDPRGSVCGCCCAFVFVLKKKKKKCEYLFLASVWHSNDCFLIFCSILLHQHNNEMKARNLIILVCMFLLKVGRRALP